VKGYTETPLPSATSSTPGSAGTAQKFLFGQDIPEQWWTLFHCRSLDELIRQALLESPTITAAQARLREASENLRASSGTVNMPSIDGSLAASRTKAAGTTGATSTYTLYKASVDVSYNLDLFQGGQRELEALQAQVDYQRLQLEGAYLALTANIVTTAVTEASLHAQIEAMREIISRQEKQLELTEKQFQLGSISQADVLAQRTQLAQTRTTLPPLEKALAQTRHLLAIYSGKLPGEASLPTFSLKEMTLPQDLPVSLPSSLVRQRPDIRASEELLHAASAQVGVATANLYPQISLSGSFGSSATHLEDLFSTSVWSIGGGLLQPLFHGGALTAKRRAAIAAYDQAMANYRNTVLLSFQDVANTLKALEMDAETLKARVDAEAAARDSLGLSQTQFQYGAVSYLTLLNAETQHQQAKINLIQAQATRFADTAALFQALGGGWWKHDTHNTIEARTDKQ
jgi:NodT family efflux transporter outer membrane factor (OMF) lipoprotein